MAGPSTQQFEAQTVEKDDDGAAGRGQGQVARAGPAQRHTQGLGDGGQHIGEAGVLVARRVQPGRAGAGHRPMRADKAAANSLA